MSYAPVSGSFATWWLPMRIALVVHENFSAAAVGAILDIFRVAEFVRPRLDASIPAFEVLPASAKKRVTSAAGMALEAVLGLGELSRVDTVILAALGTVSEEHTEQMLASSSVQATVEAMQGGPLDGVRIAAACTGVFTLAETGMLNGRTVTSTWYQAPLFRHRYPEVDLSLDAMVVDDERFTTAGAAFAHIDLALALLRRESTIIAEEVTRMLLVDERHSQSSFVAYDHFRHENETVKAFEKHVRAHLAQPLDIGTVCSVLGVGRRTLERSTKTAVGMSPLEIIRRLRIEKAEHLKRTTDLSMDQISDRVGYRNTDSLRALLRSSS